MHSHTRAENTYEQKKQSTHTHTIICIAFLQKFPVFASYLVEQFIYRRSTAEQPFLLGNCNAFAVTLLDNWGDFAETLLAHCTYVYTNNKIN